MFSFGNKNAKNDETMRRLDFGGSEKSRLFLFVSIVFTRRARSPLIGNKQRRRQQSVFTPSRPESPRNR